MTYMKNTPISHKIATSIIYGIYGAINVYLLVLLQGAVSLGIELSILPVILISLTIIICITTIIGIWKNNYTLLIIGLILAVVKLLDTVSAIINRVFFDQPMNLIVPTVTGLLFLYAFFVILKGIRRHKKA